APDRFRGIRRRDALYRLRARAGRHAAGGIDEGGEPRLGAGAPPDDPGAGRARLRPCARRGPPGPQAREPHGDPDRGAAERHGARLRPRGLAREVEDWSLPRLTATREILGTPSYAAPEQLRGEPVSTRSDLYAWGLILLECLT